MLLKINDDEVEVSDNLELPLLWALRDELGLTGTKFGCGMGICGACTVHLNGMAIRSCITPLSAVEGQEIRTIEGLAVIQDDDTLALHPVQQAFIDHQVPQCGWCMSGQIMQAAAFLDSNSTPSEQELVSAMGNSYCRCGCYVRIKEAVATAAAQIADSRKGLL